MTTLRRRAGSIGAGACVLSLVLTTVSSTPTNANPPARKFGGPVQRVTTHHVRRFDASASCTGSGTGQQAFDSTTTFMTNNVANFGFETLAAADGAGVFAGKGSIVCDYYSGIGAGYENLVDSGYGGEGDFAADSFIGAGTSNLVAALNSFVGAGKLNSVTASTAFIGAGAYNAAGGNDSSVDAGYHNSATEESSTVAGGVWGTATGAGALVGAGGEEYYLAQKSAPATYGNMAGATDSFVGAGDLNQISSTGYGSFIGAGGYDNAEQKIKGAANSISGSDSFIGAGDNNTITGNYAVVGGGNNNKVAGERGFIGGGYGNSASAEYAAIPGGDDNTAGGVASFAAGHLADATQKGSFVWSDESGGSSALKDTAANQFVARATGGFYFYTSSSGGAELKSGSGAWASLSDRNAKTAIVPLDDAAVLAKVATLPISSWQYKTERGVTHVGPMAQDFYAAFGVGEDDRHITSIDEDGVALAAIEALHRENSLLRSNFERENAAKDASIRALSDRVRRLDAAVARLLARR